MRQISFAMTIPQFHSGLKDVTRRVGWAFLKPGDNLRVVEKCMGLRRGESPVVMGIIRVACVSREPLDDISDADVTREGFPGMPREEFVSMFCAHMNCKPAAIVTRIEFEKVAASSS